MATANLMGNVLTSSTRTLWRVRASVGDCDWMQNAAPHEVLGLPTRGFTLEDVKSAFRKKVKEYHPDVYKGREDAQAITHCLIQAYELLATEVRQGPSVRCSDPFKHPEEEANDIFVNELLCIGKGCSYSCVKREPAVFIFAPDTGCGRAVVQGKGSEYNVQLAVGQCPRDCIYFVTNSQREVLDALLRRILDDPISSEGDVMVLQELVALANFENGRYIKPKN